MSDTPIERRMAENEAMFRSHNEGMQQGFNELNKTAEELGEEPYELDNSVPLHFYCECADETCTERIKILPRDYKKIHANRQRFAILPGHQVETIEDVIEKTPEYWVVQKHYTPPEMQDTLNDTPINNT